MPQNIIIKICGLRDAEMLEAAIAAGADMVGFVNFPKSPRHVQMDQIGELISVARGRVETVVLMVNPDNSRVAEVAAFDPDFIQLHGSEPPERVEAIRAEGGIPVVKAVAIASPEDVARVAEFEAVADRVLLDAKAPKDADRPGGLGTVFDWSLLKALDPAIEFMLSGGLTPDNVADAVKQVSPWGVDASSGIEIGPGQKDPALIQRFVSAARGA